MREALQQTLHLRFPQARDTAAHLQESEQPTLAAQLTQGIIAYFQVRWQTRSSAAVRQAAHQAFAAVLDKGQPQLAQTSSQPQLELLLGLAAVFDALLAQQDAAWPDMQRWRQGRTWLQEALIHDETVADAHLGLGMLYFAGAEAPGLLQRFLSSTIDPGEAIAHLRRAADAGAFSQDVARTFLLQIYVQEARYPEAIALGQALQTTYADNGYYALLTGRSQYAYGQTAACSTTLGALAAALPRAPERLSAREDRFDLYYTWGRALLDTQDDAQAFQAFRQAINQDPRAEKDESLWAKYYLATLYERRGATKTAQQLYQTLLRGRNVETLHHQVAQRLEQLP
jgi:tetratricopeptide (TPR) repeat protein